MKTRIKSGYRQWSTAADRQNGYRNSKQEKEQSTGQGQQWTVRTASKSRIKVQARVSNRQSEKVQEQQQQ